MDDNERQVIDELFEKIRAVEDRSGGRDAEAETRIRDHIVRQPAAPYYMAQTILVQQQALAAAEARIDDLERQLSERASNSFLSGLFGGPRSAGRPMPAAATGWDARVAAYADPHHRQGRGFLAGAAQTAVGVAGGVLLGSALAELFAADAAAGEIGEDDRLVEDVHYEDEPDTGFDTDDEF